MNRLSQLPTLRINPAQKISLNYKRKIYQGIGGDTIATALYANAWMANAAIPVWKLTAYPMYALKIRFLKTG